MDDLDRTLEKMAQSVRAARRLCLGVRTELHPRDVRG